MIVARDLDTGIQMRLHQPPRVVAQRCYRMSSEGPGLALQFEMRFGSNGWYRLEPRHAYVAELLARSRSRFV